MLLQSLSAPETITLELFHVHCLRWDKFSPESAHAVVARHRLQSSVLPFLVLSKFLFAHEYFWADLAAHSCAIFWVVCSVLVQSGICWEITGTLGTEIEVELMHQLYVFLQDWPGWEFQVAMVASESFASSLQNRLDCSVVSQSHGGQLYLKEELKDQFLTVSASTEKILQHCSFWANTANSWKLTMKVKVVFLRFVVRSFYFRR